MGRWYVLPVNPEPWAIGPVGFSRRSGKLSAYVGRNQQLDAYKESVAEAIASEHPEMIEGEVSVTFFFWRHRAEYTTQYSRQHRKHEADATNMQKATEDALQGIMYRNDKDNRHVSSYVVDQGPEVEGRVVVYAEEYVGFDEELIPKHVLTAVKELASPERTIPKFFDRGPVDGIF